MAFIPVISPTTSRSLDDCEMKVVYEALGEFKAFCRPLHSGKAFHDIARLAIERQRDTGETMGLDELGSELHRKLRLPEKNTEAPDEGTVMSMLEDGMRSLTVFHERLLPSLRIVRPLEAEKNLRLHVTDALGTVQISGRADLLFYSPRKDRYLIVDLKTGQADKTDERELSQQLSVYYAAALRELGLEEDDPPLDAFALYLDVHENRLNWVEYQPRYLKRDLAYLTAQARRLYSLTDFHENRGPHCFGCSYRCACGIDGSQEIARA